MIAVIATSAQFNCQSSRSDKQPEKPPRDTSGIVRETTSRAADSSVPINDSVLSPMIKLNSVTPNLSIVGIQVDSLVIVDSLYYIVFAYIATAIQETILPSFAEPDTRLVLEPMYAKDPKVGIDLNNAKNKQLLWIRSLKSKDSFLARITLTSAGKWLITEIVGH